MICPKCGIKTKTIETRDIDAITRRRHKCPKCRLVFRTVEQVDFVPENGEKIPMLKVPPVIKVQPSIDDKPVEPPGGMSQAEVSDRLRHPWKYTKNGRHW